jgi:hypothetical protein
MQAVLKYKILTLKQTNHSVLNKFKPGISLYCYTEKDEQNSISPAQIQWGYFVALSGERHDMTGLFRHAELLRRLPRFLVPAAQPQNILAEFKIRDLKDVRIL